MSDRTRTTAQALAEATDLMIAMHDKTCPVPNTEPEHYWSQCINTPTLYAAADALDILRSLPAAPGRDGAVALVVHDRMCRDMTCGPEQRVEHAAAEWLAHGRAAEAWHEEDHPATTTAQRYDRRMCACTHIRMGHSVDGTRCYATPCDCAHQGGFREVEA